jgi:two-component system chemotaxis response regulator CheY
MKRSVLLVDDSDTIRYIIRVYLMGMNLELIEADRAERALRLLGASPVDLILADINMPQMNGLDFVRKVRGDDRDEVRLVPVVLLTGDKAPGLEAKGLEAGATEVIRKPVSIATLVGAVRRHLRLPEDPSLKPEPAAGSSTKSLVA